MLDAQGGLTIDDYTQIALNVMIWSHTSHWQTLASNKDTGREDIPYKPMKIGSHVFIAGPSVIAPGVSIGDRVCISPLSFVDRDLPDNSVFSPSCDLRMLQAKVRKMEEVIDMLLGQGARHDSKPGDADDV